MIYPFKCKICGHYEEVFRPASEASLPEICCGQPMQRQYTTPQVNLGESRLCFQKAREEHKKAGGTGDITEIGNENPTAHKTPKSYDIDPRVCNEYPELSQLKD